LLNQSIEAKTNKNNNFSVTVKIWKSEYQTLERFIAHLLQILGCELHKNAFGVRAPLDLLGAIALPRPSSRYRGEREGRGRKGVEIVGRRGRGEKGRT